MSETHDISEAHTIPAIPAMSAAPAGVAGMPMDFGPLIDDMDDMDDFDLTPMPPVRRPGNQRKRWLSWLIIGLLVVLLGGGIITYARLTRAPSVQYTQAAATVGNLAVTVSGTGPVQANAVYNLNFSASAPIKAIYVKVGDQVTAGQKLASLDSTSLQDAVNQAQTNVNAAQTSVNQANTNLNNTKTQQATALNIAFLNEQKALSACTSSSGTTGGTGSSNGGNPGATPSPTATPDAAAIANCQALAKAQFTQAQQQANSSINSATNQVTSAEQQLSNANTALQTAKDNLANATLTAPHAGVIESVNGLVGETAGGGNGSSGGSASSGSSAFIVLVDASTLNIAAQINEANIASVAVNQSAQFTVAAYPSQTFRASVTGIDTMGSTTSNVVTYLVNLAVDMQSLNDAHVYPGMTATVNITTAERISTLLVPSTALSFSTTALQNGELTRSQLGSLVSSGSSTSATGGSRGIVIELKAGKLVPVLVTTGLTNGQFTEILSGLKEGDEVVVSQTGGTTSTGTNTNNGGGGRGGFGGGGFGGGGFGGGGGRGGGGGGGGN